MTKEGKNAPPAIEPGLVSVVLVNYRGAEDTVTCLRSFGGIDWPADRLELIVVDNASGDGSVERIRAEVAHAQVVCSEVNRGFAGGCNLGAAHARGEYLAFINNDARPGAEWIKAAVEVLRAQADVGCVASKVLDWEGERIDFVDGSLTWYGMGYKRECEQPDTGEWDTPKDVLFATGAAMFVRADVYRAVDGFDDRYFMFYEDVDLGWRLNLLGWRVRYVPRSLAYHRHHASMKSYGPWREHFLLERNALMSLYKNLGEAKLAKALPAEGDEAAGLARRAVVHVEAEAAAQVVVHVGGRVVHDRGGQVVGAGLEHQVGHVQLDGALAGDLVGHEAGVAGVVGPQPGAVEGLQGQAEHRLG